MTILLDIDGVMVSAKSWERPKILDDGFYDFLPSAVNYINKIIRDNSDTKIVLTTSHRSIYTSKQWKDVFNRRGIQIDQISTIGRIMARSRKEEVEKWLDMNNIIDNYIVIDDDSSMYEFRDQSRLIHTVSHIGLR